MKEWIWGLGMLALDYGSYVQDRPIYDPLGVDDGNEGEKMKPGLRARGGDRTTQEIMAGWR